MKSSKILTSLNPKIQKIKFKIRNFAAQNTTLF